MTLFPAAGVRKAMVVLARNISTGRVNFVRRSLIDEQVG